MQGSELLEILAANLRSMRREAGYSQVELAARVGISTGYMCDIENGRKWPSADTLVALSTALKLDPYQLILPSVDSPYLDRHRAITSFSQHIKSAIENSVDEAYESFMKPYGPLRKD
ncbi:MAG: hypothetical protein B0D92_00200 [Spirochaeta sp. LUC14_002_19_P3]|nr:MAG: hypothetical protein B0D92_00200 [Spirochaeta sp. LUC14_002_19_P3]